MQASISNPWDEEYTNHQINPTYGPLWDVLKEFLSSYSINSILDFGCGDGNYSFLMSKLGLNVVGIDRSSKAIDKAVLNKQIQKINGCRFYCNEEIPSDLQIHSFDAVLMLNSYHCLTSSERFNLLNQINEVLKEDGYLFASVLSNDDESYPRKIWKNIEENTFEDESGKIFHFFSEDEILMELNQYEILQLRTLKNVHPEYGRKSSLITLVAKCKKAKFI